MGFALGRRGGRPGGASGRTVLEFARWTGATTSSSSALLDAADYLAQGINFAFVPGLLAFGFLKQFQHELHLIQCIAQVVDDVQAVDTAERPEVE